MMVIGWCDMLEKAIVPKNIEGDNCKVKYKSFSWVNQENYEEEQRFPVNKVLNIVLMPGCMQSNLHPSVGSFFVTKTR